MLSEYEGILYIRKRPIRRVRSQKSSLSNQRLREFKEKGLVQVLKDYGYWNPIIGTIKFMIHFGLVMGLLFCGAWVFAKLEDPQVDFDEIATTNHTQLTTHNTSDSDVIWLTLKEQYNISINPALIESFAKDIHDLIQKETDHKQFVENQLLLQDRDFIWMKWFYFTTICTTTIGYGDVMPETENGRLFYIFFSIFGIATMMTLLQSCGVVITKANKKFYGLLNHYICNRGGGAGAISQELLSVISITIIFFGFLAAGIWYDTTKLRQGYDWTYINVVYFWIVTFTTVGFDTPIPLDKELQHVYELLLYRLFGLSFLAGIIDSLKVYFDFRKELFKEKAKELSALRTSLKSGLNLKSDENFLLPEEKAATSTVENNKIDQSKR